MIPQKRDAVRPPIHDDELDDDALETADDDGGVLGTRGGRSTLDF